MGIIYKKFKNDINKKRERRVLALNSKFIETISRRSGEGKG